MANIRGMCRKYAEWQVHRRSMLIRESGGQGGSRNTRRIHHGEILNWMIDFERCLNRLTKPDRTMLLLVYGAGYRPSEVARLTGNPAWTVERHVRQAEDQLDDMIEAQEESQRSPGVILEIHAVVDAVFERCRHRPSRANRKECAHRSIGASERMSA